MAITLVKICGITSPEMATYAAKRGAAYIGIVLCQKSVRYVSLDNAKIIAEAAKLAGAIPVAVFTETNADEIVRMANVIGVDVVQLHGRLSRAALTDLQQKFQVIYAVDDSHQIPSTLRSDKDFLLFDGVQPGSGQILNWTEIKLPKNMRCFLAGGLTAKNVAEAISIVKPYVVDVSSGVERAPGVKDEALINSFIESVL